MNNEEAIKYLNNHYLVYVPHIQDNKAEIDKHNEVIYLAISALKKVDESDDFKKGYSKALEDFKKFSVDYNSCDHNCDENGSCIDCFINTKKGTKDGLS